jgi:predicted TIM-barrel fold metal-dependent hydrolase
MNTPRYPVIDADGHVEEAGVDWLSRLGTDWGDWAPRYITDGHLESGQRRFVIEGKTFPRWEDKWGRASRPIKTHKPPTHWTDRPGMMDPKSRLVDMDVEGIDVAVLFGGALSSATIGLVENPKLALDTCRAYNDWLAEYCGAAPERLKGVALVPFQDPEAGARELRRAVRELGLIAFRIPTWPDGRDPGQRLYDPIYAAADDLGVPGCIHLLSARTIGADRFDNFFLKHVFYGADVFMSFCALIAGGALDRFPNLKVGVFEAGCGWIPYLVERMHEHWELFPDQLPHLKTDPAEYMSSERCYYTMEPEEASVSSVAKVIGEDTLMYASDYAHFDCMCPESVSAVAGRDDLGEELKRKVLGANAARFFNIKVA